MPKTLIVCSQIDPLRDCSYLMALRMKKAGVDVDLVLMKDYIHGFGAFFMSHACPEYRNGVNYIIKQMAGMLDVELASAKLI